MASTETKHLHSELAREREQLADALEDLRGELAVGKKLQSKLPLVAGAAAGAGFVLAGGIGATMRLLFRRRREGDEKAKVGRFSVVRR